MTVREHWHGPTLDHGYRNCCVKELSRKCCGSQRKLLWQVFDNLYNIIWQYMTECPWSLIDKGMKSVGKSAGIVMAVLWKYLKQSMFCKHCHNHACDDRRQRNPKTGNGYSTVVVLAWIWVSMLSVAVRKKCCRPAFVNSAALWRVLGDRVVPKLSWAYHGSQRITLR